MTVKELKEELSFYDEDADVVFEVYGNRMKMIFVAGRKGEPMICETCTHADNIYPGCIDCVIGADPFWDDEEDCEDCTYYHEAETLKAKQ